MVRDSRKARLVRGRSRKLEFELLLSSLLTASLAVSSVTSSQTIFMAPMVLGMKLSHLTLYLLGPHILERAKEKKERVFKM